MANHNLAKKTAGMYSDTCQSQHGFKDAHKRSPYTCLILLPIQKEFLLFRDNLVLPWNPGTKSTFNLPSSWTASFLNPGCNAGCLPDIFLEIMKT